MTITRGIETTKNNPITVPTTGLGVQRIIAYINDNVNVNGIVLNTENNDSPLIEERSMPKGINKKLYIIMSSE